MATATQRAKTKTCRTCRQPVAEKPVAEDQTRNGVKVIVYRFKTGGTIVDATCQCFGSPKRLHTNEKCPLLLRLRAGEHVTDD
ncbi:MAG TPA: hypothetical protein VLE97_07400 [Gaiellaceae bacterium]|nr:hypothetical protein [Gaiellaceae bacterium]